MEREIVAVRQNAVYEGVHPSELGVDELAGMGDGGGGGEGWSCGGFMIRGGCTGLVTFTGLGVVITGLISLGVLITFTIFGILTSLTILGMVVLTILTIHTNILITVTTLTIHCILHILITLITLITPITPITLQNPVQRHTQVAQHHRHVQPVSTPLKRLRRLPVTRHTPRGETALQVATQLVQSPREIRRLWREQRQCRQIHPAARVPREEVQHAPAVLEETVDAGAQDLLIGVYLHLRPNRRVQQNLPRGKVLTGVVAQQRVEVPRDRRIIIAGILAGRNSPDLRNRGETVVAASRWQPLVAPAATTNVTAGTASTPAGRTVMPAIAVPRLSAPPPCGRNRAHFARVSG